MKEKRYPSITFESDILSDLQIPFAFEEKINEKQDLKVLSLFSGCGGMDLGFEGNFMAHKKSISPSANVKRQINKMLRKEKKK